MAPFSAMAPMASRRRFWLLLVAAAACFLYPCSQSFATSPASVATGDALAADGLRPRGRPMASWPLRGSGGCYSSRQSPFSAAFLLGVTALAAAFRLRSRSSSSTARRITMQDIDNVTLDDVPIGYWSKVSIGRARRSMLAWEITDILDNSFFVFFISTANMTLAYVKEMRLTLKDNGCKTFIYKKSYFAKVLELAGDYKELGGKIRKTVIGPSIMVAVPRDDMLKKTLEVVAKVEKKQGRKGVIAAWLEKWGKDKSPLILGRSLLFGQLKGDPKIIDGNDIPKLKDLPTKQQTIGMIAGGIKQVTTRLARSTKQVSQKLAIGLKKVTEKMTENDKATVKDIAL